MHRNGPEKLLQGGGQGKEHCGIVRAERGANNNNGAVSLWLQEGLTWLTQEKASAKQGDSSSSRWVSDDDDGLRG